MEIYDSLTITRPCGKALGIMWEETRNGSWDAGLSFALEQFLAESGVALIAMSP